MKVSRSSWHYRLYRYVHNTSRGPAFLNPFTNRERREAELPKSLCPYAWSIFLGLLGSVFLFAVLAAFSWLFLAVYLLVRLHRQARRIDARIAARWSRREKPEREPEPPREKKPSLVAAFLRARKEKVCPTITLVD